MAAFAAAAGAATTAYPAGGSTFGTDAQGWAVDGESCGLIRGIGILCTTSGAYDGAVGNPGGALATTIDVTLNALGLLSSTATWTSPAFTIPSGDAVTGATFTYDTALAEGGLVNLGLASDVGAALEDLTAGTSSPLGAASLDDRSTSFNATSGAVPSGALVPGHTYRLVLTVDTTSSATSLGLLGNSQIWIDNVALAVTTADPSTGGGGRAGGGGTGTGGTGGTGTGGSGGAGGSGGSGASGGGAGTSGSGPSGTGGGSTAGGLSQADFTALLRSLDLTAQVGLLGGGSLVPRNRCTIVGTPRADRLVGTPGRDVICGLGGSDVIVGRGGTDLIDGGAGNDRINGGSAADVLLGLRGADLLAGAAGRDLLMGGAGNDVLRGGPSFDRLSGGAGRDVSRSGLRQDHIAGVERRLR